jgi:hypothetical protein
MELIIWQYDVKNIYEICNYARDLEYTNVVLLIKTNVNRVKIIYIFMLSLIDYHDCKLKTTTAIELSLSLSAGEWYLYHVNLVKMKWHFLGIYFCSLFL